MDEQKNKEYIEIDIEELSASLAKNDWEQGIENIPNEDVYELVTSGDERNITMIKQPKSYWANIYWNLKTLYESLIRSYQKPDVNESTTQTSGDNNRMGNE